MHPFALPALALTLALLGPAARAAPLFTASDLPQRSQDAPLAYVNRPAAAAQPLTLTHAPQGGDAVAHVPAGGKLRVLLVDDAGHYLAANAFGLVGWAQPGSGKASDSFGALATLRLRQDGDTPFTLHYPPRLAKVLNQPIDDDLMLAWHALRIALQPGGPVFTLDCDSGPSADPGCSFTPGQPRAQGSGTQGHMIGGDKFFMPGNGFVYVDSYANDIYRVRRKWAVAADGSATEVPQPYYYVGMQSRTTAPLVLQGLDGARHTVKTGAPVHVLLNAPQRAPCAARSDCTQTAFLVQAGKAVGWASVDYSAMPPVPIKDAYLRGD